MSQMFEIGLGGQNVNYQSLALLDGANLFSGGSSPETSAVCRFWEDDGDIFICGKCRRQWGSLSVFMLHKREGCGNSVAVSTPTTSNLSLPDVFVKNESLGGGEGEGEDSRDKGLSGSGSGEGDDGTDFESHRDGYLSPNELSDDRGNAEDHGDGDGETSCGGLLPPSSVIQMPSSMLLSDDTLSLTIPLDSSSQLGQLLAGPDSQTVLHIPENELAALIAGERIHISTGNSENPGYYVTASLLPSNLKEPLSERNLPADNGYISMAEAQTQLNGVLSNNMQSGTVIRVRKEKPGNLANRENSQQHHRHTKPKSRAIVEMKKSGECNTNTTPASQPKEKSGEPGDAKRKCEYCGKPFKKLFNLHQHIRSHTGEKPFHCLVCGRGFTQKSNVKKHMSTHKVWPKIKYTLPKEQISVKLKEGDPVHSDAFDGDPKPTVDVEYIVNNVYVCQYCDQHFENYHKLKTHLSHTHKNEKLFKCIHKECTATFLEVEGLISHMKTHENQLEYQCQDCPKKFKNLYDLGAHQYTHRLCPNRAPVQPPPKQFRCTKCNSKYASAEALNHHLLTSSHNYPCSQCQLTFVCERYLRRHLRIHGTVEPFKCLNCSKMFKTENYLKSHMVIHSEKKPFTCDVCMQSFNRRDKLTRHKLMHDNRKKYKCPFKSAGCEREFYRKDKLKDHMLAHTRKVYPCSKCGKNFSWPIRLRKNQSTAQPELQATSTCGSCQKMFKSKNAAKGHISFKGATPPSLLDADLANVDIQNPAIGPQVGLTSETDFVNEPINHVVVLYNDCEMEDSRTSEKIEPGAGVMLASCHQNDSADSVMFARYDMEDKVCPDLDTTDTNGLDQLDMHFETGVDGHMDHLIAAE